MNRSRIGERYYVGAFTQGRTMTLARAMIYEFASDRLLAYAEGKPIDVINPEALKKGKA